MRWTNGLFYLNMVVVRHALFVPKGNTNDCESRRRSLLFHRPMNGKQTCTITFSNISYKKHITRTLYNITFLVLNNGEPVLKYPSSHEIPSRGTSFHPRCRGRSGSERPSVQSASETRRNFCCMDQRRGAGTCSQKQRVYVSSGNG